MHTNTLIAILTSYNEHHIFLQFNQKGFKPQCRTARQIQIIIVALKDVLLIDKDIYLTYIDFHNAFGSTYHTWLLAFMEDLRYSTRCFSGTCFGTNTTTFTLSNFTHNNAYTQANPSFPKV